MGLLDREIAKLANSVGNREEIRVEDVEKLVGRSSQANVFRIMDAIGEGKPGEALSILEELFTDGADPMGILAPLTFQLRKLANVGRLTASGIPLSVAMDTALVAKWDNARISFEKQLRHLGRRRLEKLSDWLVEINVGLKGGNPLPERVQVERLIVMMARPREEVKS
jgi:DNA polymerase-3 subunit delta